MTASLRSGALAAYVALCVAVFGLPLIAISDPECRFVGSATQDYTSDVTEPAHTGAPIAFLGGPLLAVAALVLLVLARRKNPAGRPSRLAFACAIAVFPVAFVDFAYFLVKGLDACGAGF